MTLTFLLGGVRAGKSARALALATEFAANGNVLFVATAQPFDHEMERRIVAHRAERPAHWRTLEEPVSLTAALEPLLESATDSPSVIVIDCLTLWVSNLLLALDNGDTNNDSAELKIGLKVAALIALMQRQANSSRLSNRAECHWIVVSNEVGLGVVPPTVLGRNYRDALGRANQLVAAAADTVTLMVAGLEIPLKASNQTNADS